MEVGVWKGGREVSVLEVAGLYFSVVEPPVEEEEEEGDDEEVDTVMLLLIDIGPVVVVLVEVGLVAVVAWGLSLGCVAVSNGDVDPVVLEDVECVVDRP